MERSSRLRLIVDSSDIKDAERHADKAADSLDRMGDEADQLEKKSRRAKGEVRDLGAAAAKIGLQITAAAAAAGGLIAALTFKQSIAAAQEQELALAQVRQGIESTGGVARRTLQDIERLTAGIQVDSLFGDEQLQLAAANLLTFTNIAETAFDRTLVAAGDVSQRVGQDLNSTIIQLGKALNDPVANLGALSRTGIQFTDSQTELIKSLAETNRLAEAQAVILTELEAQYGGSAKAARDTFGGAITAVKNNYGDLLELLGQPTIEETKDEFNLLADALSNPQLQANILALGELLANMLEGFISSLAIASEKFSNFIDALQARGLVPLSIGIDTEALSGGPLGIADIRDVVGDGLSSRQVTDVERQIEKLQSELRIQQDLLIPGFLPGGVGKDSGPTDDLRLKLGLDREIAGLETQISNLNEILGFNERELKRLAEAAEGASGKLEKVSGAPDPGAISRGIAAATAQAEFFGRGNINDQREIFTNSLTSALEQSGLSGKELSDVVSAQSDIYARSIIDGIDAANDNIGPAVERGAQAGIEKGLSAAALSDAFSFGADLFDGLDRAIDDFRNATGGLFERLTAAVGDIGTSVGRSLNGLKGSFSELFGESGFGDLLGSIGDKLGAVGAIADFAASAISFFKGLFGTQSSGATFDLSTGAALFERTSVSDERNQSRNDIGGAAVDAANTIAEIIGGEFEKGVGLRVFIDNNDRLLASLRDTSNNSLIALPDGVSSDSRGNTDDPNVAISQGVQLLLENAFQGGEAALKDYAIAAFDAGRSTDEVVSGLKSLEGVLSLTVDPLSQVETALKQIDDTINPVIEDLQSLGQSIADIEGVASQAVRALGEAFIGDIEQEILDLRNSTLGDFQRILKAQEQLVSDATALLERGAITLEEFDLVQVRNALEREAFFEGLNPDELDSLGDFFGLIENAGGSVAVVLTQLTSAFSDFTDGVAETRDRLQSQADQLRGYADQIISTRDRIDTRFPSQSGGELLGDLRGQLANLREGSLAGDDTAFEKIPDLANRFVDLARGIFGATEDFAKERDFALQVLDQTGALAENRANKLLTELEALNTQVDVLNDIRAAIESPDPAVDLIRSQLDQGAVANDLLRQLLEQYIALTAEARAGAITPGEAQAASEGFLGAGGGSGGQQQQAIDFSENVVAINAVRSETSLMRSEVTRILKDILLQQKRSATNATLTG